VAGDGDFSVPRWSPDGENIAFRNNPDGLSAEVGVMALDGSSPVSLTQGANERLWNLAVHWLPDGQELAYGSWLEPEALHVWAISRFGGEPRRLLANVEGSQNVVLWNPLDPSVVAYLEFGGERSVDLWSMSEGAAPVNLTQGRVFAPGNAEWSPDGTRIAFAAFVVLEDGSIEGLDGHAALDAEIFVIDVETQELTRVTDNEWDDTTPTWAPDGERLLIASLREGDTDLWLVPLDDPEQAHNLIDDAAAPREDSMPHWYKAP
jgi:TolB protein